MHHIILCTCPDYPTAEKIAHDLIKKQLAGCVNIAPGITSIYAWQGRIESSQEHLLIIKSHQDRYTAIESVIQTLHPYELPEIIAVPVECGLPEYLQWIDSCLITE